MKQDEKRDIFQLQSYRTASFRRVIQYFEWILHTAYNPKIAAPTCSQKIIMINEMFECDAMCNFESNR